MKRIDDREGIPDSHMSADQPPPRELRRSPVMMVDAILEDLAAMDINLENVTLEEMKQLFADACRDVE